MKPSAFSLIYRLVRKDLRWAVFWSYVIVGGYEIGEGDLVPILIWI
jgi:hypothetical protein